MLKILIITFLLISTLKADDISNIMNQIKTAKLSEKRVLINKLKVMLRNSNEKTRTLAILNLRKSHNMKKHQNKKYNQKMNHNINENFKKQNNNFNQNHKK